ncbi:putative integral membrane protein [Babesia bovis T2Bo]|uniref:Membrane protein, putative n=1 Tax=Babesia bovis TaxID=5865 RepID=A7ANZ9_BABBO|nr:putative integral membrane protein [Babesia bovis T2Bo]EDO08283.1 putative integral membrane protein [Babesia bovis T2Bo]BAN64732.1 membrane protein, putative [Babesia bovis]|eukprot:XP_001611851.1 membrane protein [Babesia bovis T2Bo]
MKFSGIASAFLAIGSAIFGAASASYAGENDNAGILSELMIVKNNEDFVARRYGTFNLPNLVPGEESSPAGEPSNPGAGDAEL